MPKFTKKKLKVVATLASVALFATAFTPGGCTFNVDQGLLNQLGGLFGGGPGHWDDGGGQNDGWNDNGNDNNGNDNNGNDNNGNDNNGNDNNGNDNNGNGNDDN